MSYWKNLYNPNYIASFENEKIVDLLVGRKIVRTEFPALVLDDGTKLIFDTDNSDCCSYLELTSLAAVDHVITSVKVTDNEDETGGEGPYKAALYVLTEAGTEEMVAQADGDASNGYYLHGFALGVLVERPKEDT